MSEYSGFISFPKLTNKLKELRPDDHIHFSDDDVYEDDTPHKLLFVNGFYICEVAFNYKGDNVSDEQHEELAEILDYQTKLDFGEINLRI